MQKHERQAISAMVAILPPGVTYRIEAGSKARRRIVLSGPDWERRRMIATSPRNSEEDARQLVKWARATLQEHSHG